MARYDILGCKDGKYQNIFSFAGDFDVALADIFDFNKDGIPELILYDVTHYGFVDGYIFEWDGNKFRSLINMGTDISIGTVIDAVSSTAPHKLIDTNGNGLKEVIFEFDAKELCGGFGDYCNGTPAPKQTTILSWNGKNYVNLQQESHTAP